MAVVNRFAALGRAIGERQDADRRGDRNQSRAYRALFARRAVPQRRPAWPIAFAVAALTLLVLMVGDRFTGPATVRLGPYVAASDAPRAVDFADGTRVTLKPGAKATITRLDERGAGITLEHGSLYASVVSRGGRWSFDAGPYRVEVTGTAFDLTWTPPRLTLVMHEGTVRVTGPELEPTTVRAGEQLVLPRATVPTAPMPSATIAVPPAPTTAVTPAPSAPPSWQTAAAAGDNDAAYAAVAPHLDRELATLDAGAMLRLATVARLSGHSAAASRVYLRLRERFPGTAAAAEAAFALGSMSFSADGAEAERWFRTALVEASGGGLAASARGRLLELAQRRGDARAAAEDYLRHHPDGPHAALARKILHR